MSKPNQIPPPKPSLISEWRHSFEAIYRILQKDLLIETRSKYGISILVLFVVMSCSLVYFSLGDQRLRNEILSILMWNTIFFGAMSALQRGFVSEAERKTDLLLKLSFTPETIFTAKLILNGLYALALNGFTGLLYVVLLGLTIESAGVFYLTMVLGGFGLASILTLISALVASVGTRSGLFAALSFVPLLPVILLVARAAEIAAEPDAPLFRAESFLTLLAAYTIIMTALAYVLFGYIWEEV